MDRARIEQIGNQFLSNRRALAAGICLAVVVVTSTLLVGTWMVNRSIDESRVTARSANTPTRIDLLLPQKPSEVLNHIVYFNDVRLELGPADNVYYAVSPDGGRVLVVAMGSKSPLENDATVDIFGTVRAVPAASEMRQKWKLDKEETKTVREQGIFVEADSIRAKKADESARFAKR